MRPPVWAAGCNSGARQDPLDDGPLCRGKRAVGPGDLNGRHDIEEGRRRGIEAERRQFRHCLIVDAERCRELPLAFSRRFLLAGALEQFLVPASKIIGLQGTAPVT